MVDEDCSTTWKLVVPKDLRKTILHQHHDVLMAGHLGTFKTYQRLTQNYYWPKMRNDTASYVRRCQICQTTKYDNTKPSGLMGARRAVDKPWKMLAGDLMGPFRRSLAGHKYLLVVTDTFTKYSVPRPLRASTAKNVARMLEEDIFLVYGVPDYFICDNGSEFVGAQVKNLLVDYNVKMLLNASRHPQANPTGRVNKTIISMLRAYIGDNHRTWDKYISQLGFALRSAVHESTGYTPVYLTFGRELTVAERGHNKQETDDLPVVEDCKQYSKTLENLHPIYQEVTEKLKEGHEKNSHRYNLRRRHQEFKESTPVWKRNFAQSNAATFTSSKLTPRFVGPYRISKKKSPLTYELKDLQGKSAGTWHVSDLKEYLEPN